jgi:hypothetical protein
MGRHPGAAELPAMAGFATLRRPSEKAPAMSEIPQPLPRSDVIAARVEMPPDEFRRMLNEAWRNEISTDLWNRIRWLTAGVSAVAAAVISLFGAVVWTSLVGQVEREVGKAAEQAVRNLDVATVARAAADRAIKEDLASVDQVRARVRESVGPIMESAVREAEIVAQIRGHAEAAIQAQLANAGVRRDIERRLMEQQAANATLPPLLRLFALTDLLRDPEGSGIALRLLSDSARHVPPGALGGNTDEARFVTQGVATYVEELSRSAAAADFATHEALLRRLAEVVTVPPRPGNAFERLAHHFDSPAALRWLVARAREGNEAIRSLMLQALITHPAPDARERVNGLMCAADPQMRLDVLRAAAARPDALRGDAAGEAFVYLMRCVEDLVEARRVPPLDLACLPGGNLVVPWRLSRLPGTGERGESAVREQRAALEAQLRRRGGDCAAGAAVLEDPAALRRAAGWGTLGLVPGGGTALLAGLGALLPGGEEGAAPAWLADLADGRGALAAPVAAPARQPALAALVIDRLAALPSEMPGVAAARQRLIGALVAAPALPGRPAERLLLEALGPGGAICAAALNAFAQTAGAVAAAPAALGEAIACLRGARTLPPDHRAAVVAAIAAAGETGGAAGRQAMLAIAAGLNLSGAEERAASRLMDWVIRLPAEVNDAAIARALAALLAAEGPGILAGVFERPDGDALAAMQGRLRDRPAAFAPVAAASPYFDPGFAARIEAMPAPHEAGGRHWRVLRGSMPAVYALGADRAAVLLRLDPLAVLPLERMRETLETPTLQPGSYLLGAAQPGALLRLSPLPVGEAVAGLLAPGAAEPLRLGATWSSRLGPDGPRLYPFALTAGRHYEFRTLRLAPPLDTMIALLDAGGREIPNASNDDIERGVILSSRVCVQAPADGRYWLRIENYDSAPREPLAFEFRVTEVAACP